MATINGTANGETLTRKIARDIITGLGGNDQLFADYGPDLPDRGDGHDTIDGGFANDTLIRGASNHHSNDGEVATRGISAVPLCNLFRPF
jgi:Ca2+-binding RTX toxin-like protein